ncbi:MAG: ATP-binding protein [Treponema sp.]|nr:ATP-binding protein [Treponema sp.]
MEIKNQLIPNTSLINSNPVLELNTKELTSYIYAIAYEHINLNKRELDKDFLFTYLLDEDLIKISNVYLNMLKAENEKKFQELHKGEKFELSEIIENLSEDLKNNFQKYGITLYLLKQKYLEDKNTKSPLEELLMSPYMKAFCDGLNLTHKEKIFLILNLINSQCGWIFPNSESDSYKVKILGDFIEYNNSNLKVLARDFNNRFIQLGLFSNNWAVNDFVESFFTGKTPECSLKKINYSPYMDCYNFEDIYRENFLEITVWKKVIWDNTKQSIGGYELLCGSENFRLRNFASELLKRERFSLYELTPEVCNLTKDELNFYIYALSIKLKDRRAVMLISSDLLKIYTNENNKEGNVIHIVSDKKEKEFQSEKNILSKVAATIILSTDEKYIDCIQKLEDKGINIIFPLELKLPDEDSYKENACKYFYQCKVSPDLIWTAVDFCEEEKLSPSKWPEIVELLLHVDDLSFSEITMILEKKYQKKEMNIEKIRKNSHYCLEALNTSEPVSEIVTALKNAQDFQQEEYDDESGIRLLLTGPSGTGKTAYVEETAKLLKKKLSIIRASDILGGIVGETEQNIKRAFENATKEKSILLIDEADSFLHSRGDIVNRHNDLKVNEFLIQMERFGGILFCNTNFPEALDKATDRRFHFKIDFKPLTKDGVELLCKSYFEKYKFSENQINEIYSSGDVCPGDFGSLYGKIRFVGKEKINADYITNELCKLVKAKGRSWEKQKIGFNL